MYGIIMIKTIIRFIFSLLQIPVSLGYGIERTAFTKVPEVITIWSVSLSTSSGGNLPFP